MSKDINIKKDLLFTISGLLGLGYMMVTEKVNIVMVLACMFLAGVPGLQGFVSLIRSLTRDANGGGDGTTSSGSPSPSPSLPPSSLRQSSLEGSSAGAADEHRASDAA